jgi:hypothetical protein
MANGNGLLQSSLCWYNVKSVGRCKHFPLGQGLLDDEVNQATLEGYQGKSKKVMVK